MIIKLKYSVIAIHFIIALILFHSVLFKKKSEYLIPLLKIPQLPKTPNPYKVYKNLSGLIFYDSTTCSLCFSHTDIPAVTQMSQAYTSCSRALHLLPVHEPFFFQTSLWLAFSVLLQLHPNITSSVKSSLLPHLNVILFLTLDIPYLLSLSYFFYPGLTTI